jgi:hypothetical protein
MPQNSDPSGDNVIMPNGKRLADCSHADLLTMAATLRQLAAMLEARAGQDRIRPTVPGVGSA